MSRDNQNLISLSTSEKLTELDFVAAIKEGRTIMKLLVGLLICYSCG
ncbi:MAG: hypothetical protein LBF22_04345 [Deltaproteobacteria bacterium]|nr:hypothetical protein [Deltaproteobacteria bacterium]